jgi:hypothetical protein
MPRFSRERIAWVHDSFTVPARASFTVGDVIQDPPVPGEEPAGG